MFKTNLCALDSVSKGDWLLGMSQRAYAAMVGAWERMEVVTVHAVAMDSGTAKAADDYYDIELANGIKIDAVSGHHLANIRQLMQTYNVMALMNKLEVIEEPAPVETKTLGCQYMIELHVDGYKPGTILSHELMSLAIKHTIERMLETCGFGGFQTTVQSVQYEADYEIDPS